MQMHSSPSSLCPFYLRLSQRYRRVKNKFFARLANGENRDASSRVDRFLHGERRRERGREKTARTDGVPGEGEGAEATRRG